MKLTIEDIREHLAYAAERIEKAKAMGGISHLEKMKGVKVPDDWVADLYIDYWVPRPIDEPVN